MHIYREREEDTHIGGYGLLRLCQKIALPAMTWCAVTVEEFELHSPNNNPAVRNDLVVQSYVAQR